MTEYRPNDDLADKVELALQIVRLQREVAELKERLDEVARDKTPRQIIPVVQPSKLNKLLDDNSDPFRRNFRATLGHEMAQALVVGVVLLLMLVFVAILITPHH